MTIAPVPWGLEFLNSNINALKNTQYSENALTSFCLLKVPSQNRRPLLWSRVPAPRAPVHTSKCHGRNWSWAATGRGQYPVSWPHRAKVLTATAGAGAETPDYSIALHCIALQSPPSLSVLSPAASAIVVFSSSSVCGLQPSLRGHGWWPRAPSSAVT